MKTFFKIILFILIVVVFFSVRYIIQSRRCLDSMALMRFADGGAEEYEKQCKDWHSAFGNYEKVNIPTS